jgi:hypothetical protein
VDDKTYELELRFKRLYKPYAVTLKDIQKQDYLGTDTPRDYSSFVHLRDPSRNVDREVRICMNNPLRYAGETFYQSGYHRDMETFTDPATGLQRPVLVTDPETGQRQPKYVETTTLQVVANTGWMIPYVSCMIVFTGMLAHFSLILVRFLNRRAVEEHVAAAPSGGAPVDTPEMKAAAARLWRTGDSARSRPRRGRLEIRGWATGARLRAGCCRRCSSCWRPAMRWASCSPRSLREAT